jgi:hypothetical protein
LGEQPVEVVKHRRRHLTAQFLDTRLGSRLQPSLQLLHGFNVWIHNRLGKDPRRFTSSLTATILPARRCLSLMPDVSAMAY